MASSVMSTATVATGANAAQASMIASFNGLKSAASFPVTRKQDLDITSIASNGGRVQCMLVRNIGFNLYTLTQYKEFKTNCSRLSALNF